MAAFWRVVKERAQRNEKMHQIKRGLRAKAVLKAYTGLREHALREVALRTAYDKV